MADLRGIVCNYDEARPDDGNETYDPPATGIAFRAAGARDWRPMAQAALAGQVITAIETSPDHRQLAVATRVWDRADAPEAKQVLRLWLMDIADGKATSPRRLLEIVDPLANAAHFTDDDTIRALSFSADARRIVFTHKKAARASGAQADLYLVDTDAAAKVRTIQGFSRRAVAIGDDRVLGLDDGTLLDLDTGRTVARIPLQAALVRAGWIERSRLLWTNTEDGKILFRDSSDGTLVLTLHALPDNRYFAVAPGGRYDTNLECRYQAGALAGARRAVAEPGRADFHARLLRARPVPATARLPRQRHLRDRLQAVAVDRQPQPRAARGAHHRRARGSRCRRSGGGDRSARRRRRQGAERQDPFRPLQPAAVPQRPAGRDDASAGGCCRHRPRGMAHAQRGAGDKRRAPTRVHRAGADAGGRRARKCSRPMPSTKTASRARPRPCTWTRPAVAPRTPRAYVLDDRHRRLRHAALPPEVRGRRCTADGLAPVRHPRLRNASAGARWPSATPIGRRTRVDRATLARVLSLLAGNADRDATLAALRAQEASTPACCRRRRPTMR